jgi:hypothetical protein
MDAEKVKQAFDKFEKEEYTDSEEILRKEIRRTVSDKLKDDLNLQKDPIDIEDDEEEKDDEEKDDEKGEGKGKEDDSEDE